MSVYCLYVNKAQVYDIYKAEFVEDWIQNPVYGITTLFKGSESDCINEFNSKYKDLYVPCPIDIGFLYQDSNRSGLTSIYKVTKIFEDTSNLRYGRILSYINRYCFNSEMVLHDFREPSRKFTQTGQCTSILSRGVKRDFLESKLKFLENFIKENDSGLS